MGHVTHHAIVVTSWNGEMIDEARAKAESLGMSVSFPVVSSVNAYRSFLVGPDGSKSGWGYSDEGDAERDQFIAWMRSKSYEDGSSSLEWVEVSYSGDDDDAKVTRHQWQRAEEEEAGRG